MPSFGRFTDERDVLLAEAGHALCDRGLATAHGPAGVAAELVTALREHRSAVDLVVIGNGTVTGVVAMVHGDQAMLCRQPLHAERAGTVLVTRVAATALADEFAGLIPTLRPQRPCRSRFRQERSATRCGCSKTADAPATRRYVRSWSGLRRRRTVVDQLLDLFPALTGQGSLASRRTARVPPLKCPGWTVHKGECG